MDKTESKESSSGTLRRVRGKKRRRRKRRSWRERAPFRYFPDLLILLFLVLAIVLLFDPFAGMLDQASGSWRRFLEPLVVDRLGVVIGALLLVATLIAGSYRVRWRINHATRFWMHRCPACGGEDLRRVRRNPRDRWLGRLGIPARRYICPECRWVGLRIDQNDI